MAMSYDFRKLRRFITIYAVVQVVLVIMLILMALYFQAGLQAQGTPQRFLKSVIFALVAQLVLFYPVNKFASREARREVDACATELTPEELKSFRNKRMVGDIIKSAFFVFFVTFILRMPANLFLYSVTFFTFMLTPLSYLQCFNFAAKRFTKEKETPAQG